MPLIRLDLQDIQAAIDQFHASWTPADTHVSTLPEEEKIRRLGYVPSGDEVELGEREQRSASNLTAVFATQPKWPPQHDLRNVGGNNFVTAIRDQGNCGSCVSFGVIAAIETRLKLVRGNPAYAINLSEADLFFCIGRRQDRRCDSGWWVEPALRSLQREGLVKELCYPYTDHDQDCAGRCQGAGSRRTILTGWRRYQTTASMKLWITTEGPLVACFSVYNDFFSYRSGIYKHVTGDFAGGHCVCVIGYDDVQQCWICKNSWAPGWGENGFFRIAYGEVGIDAEMWTVEGIEEDALAPREG